MNLRDPSRRHRHCDGKRLFRTLAQARKEARRLSGRGVSAIQPYECRICGLGWHVGARNEPGRSEYRDGDKVYVG